MSPAAIVVASLKAVSLSILYINGKWSERLIRYVRGRKPTCYMRLILLLTLALQCYALSAQNNNTPAPKTLAAKRATSPIVIDGLLNDSAWINAPKAVGFTEFRPTPFRPEDYELRTEVYMLYDDDGIYLSGYCHERTKDSIAAEVNGRDGFGNNDFVGFIFDTYNDKINGFEYFVTPNGEQMDAKMSSDNEDFSWNAVWKSEAKVHHDGWTFEIFIPFSAIRFSKKNVQDWGLNITRRRQKTLQQYAWNPVDPNVNGFLPQEGSWTGLENIKPPLRLQFSPYLSYYVNHYPFNQPDLKNWSSSVNGGMDLKYGINQAITLDMTLIPDFGQVQSDNRVLNLSPFEVRYNENRPFFTEGTELFNKGNFFYSRRIGGTPLHYYSALNSLQTNEHFVKNPSETKLLNATKISGRLQNGLGIGFFNAVANSQYAIIADNLGNERKLETNPLTNYNIVVLDQTLKHNSSISFINTSVMRSGHDYDAFVSSGLFNFFDKKNTWNFGGKLAFSNLVGYGATNKTLSGYSHSAYFGKASGRFNFNISQELTDEKFNSNDLGYFTNNNFLNHYIW
ncbi:MAG: carbohydrate binding family 9 protein, partial [Chitinophagaceae bacterium]|nr:carbohydrate binding family 9 protein [Chitinophagaceae bacterium]